MESKLIYVTRRDSEYQNRLFFAAQMARERGSEGMQEVLAAFVGVVPAGVAAAAIGAAAAAAGDWADRLAVSLILLENACSAAQIQACWAGGVL